MTAATVTLTSFLLARIADRQNEAWGFHGISCGWLNEYPCDCGGPQQVEAECEAKRRIVEEWEAALNRHIDDTQPVDAEDFFRGGQWGIEFAVRALAAIYADHPDYRSEWRR